MQRTSEYKSTAEGSCLEDSKRKQSSIMDNYLNIEDFSKLKQPFESGRNLKSMIAGRTSNQSISSFGNTTMRLKKKINAVNAMSLSLVGCLIKEHQGKKFMNKG